MFVQVTQDKKGATFQERKTLQNYSVTFVRYLGSNDISSLSLVKISRYKRM